MNDCCKNPDNLYRRENDPEEAPSEIIKRCKVCGARHFELTVDPGRLGLKGTDI